MLPLLDRELIRANPKPFFGYSDNTNLLAFLCNTGIVGYHGATVMAELGRPGAMDPLTADSLRAALFTSGAYELRPAERWRDVNRDWADPATFDAEPETRPGDGWTWVNADRVVEGRSWGGCLEILAWLLMADREIPRDLAGTTAECCSWRPRRRCRAATRSSASCGTWASADCCSASRRC